MMKIEVFDKDKQRIIWTEEYDSESLARRELQHMKDNHFNVAYFEFYLDGVLMK